MLKQFAERNLTRTVNFLCQRSSETVNVHWDSKELMAVSFQNSNQHLLAYRALLCPASLGANYVFCGCCSSVKNFIRNYSLFLSNPNFSREIHRHCVSHLNAFDLFLVGIIKRDIEILKSVIEILPTFWDALLYLADIADHFIEISSPLKGYFYMILKIKKDIDPPGFKVEFIKNIIPSLDLLPYQIERSDKNLLAAFLYCYGNNDESLRVFLSIIDSDDIRFFDIFAILLFLKNDQNLVNLAEILARKYKNHPIMLAVQAIYKTSIGHNEEAKQSFKKALRRDSASAFEDVIGICQCQYAECLNLGSATYESLTAIQYTSLEGSLSSKADVHCMLGHVYINLKEKEQAIKHFNMALRSNQKNFRILYTIAQGYYSLGEMSHSLFMCRRAVDQKSDGSIWKLMGRIYMKLDDFTKAMSCFTKAEKMRENDSLLYMAELCKKNKKMETAAAYYEKYVKIGDKNREVVSKYLAEYYEGIGDIEKSSFYRNIV
jgi:tetratricopeptide (TPR) repeat protein